MTFWLYLAMISGRLHDLFIFSGGLACVAIAFAFLIFISGGQPRPKDEERARAYDDGEKFFKKVIKILAGLALALFFIAAILPDATTAYLMVGGHYIDTIANGEVGARLQEMLVLRIDEELAQ